jgi:hypothetical protein
MRRFGDAFHANAATHGHEAVTTGGRDLRGENETRQSTYG